MSEPSLPTKVVAIHEALATGKVDHAFGGALALAYYAEPRATVDIDLNVFVEPSAFGQTTKVLAPLGVDDSADPAVVERDGQCRLRWGRTPVDLFFAYDPFHEAMRRATRTVPFGSTVIPVLSPEHLIVCKAAFDRPKDWLDIEQILVGCDVLDRSEVARWLSQIVGDADDRARRFDGLADQYLGPSAA